MMSHFLRIFFLFFIQHLYGDEYTGNPEKLLTLSKNISIEMNDINQEIENQDLKKEPKRNEEILRYKMFPWGKFLLLLVGIITLIALRYLPREKKVIFEDKTAPEEKAQNRLSAIEEQHLPADEFYAKILYIFKLYVEERYQINAPAKTKEEFLKALQNHELAEKIPEKNLSELLKIADLVNYAGIEPTDAECNKARNILQNLIHQK